jgi:hypothetical protein
MGVYEDGPRAHNIAWDRLPNGVIVSTIWLGGDVYGRNHETTVFLDGHGPSVIVYGDHAGDRRAYRSDEAAMVMHEEFLSYWRAVPCEQTVPMLVDALAVTRRYEQDAWRESRGLHERTWDERNALRKAMKEIASLARGRAGCEDITKIAEDAVSDD